MTDCAATRLAPVKRPPATWSMYLKVVVLSLVGGAFGIVGAFVTEVRGGGGILLVVLGAPVAEEALKPIGVYLSLLRWPQALTSRLFRAVLCAGAGVVFGLIESATYVYVYAPDHPDWYPLFRFTIPVMLHAIASFTVGLGVDRQLLDWANLGTRMPKRTRNFFIAGVAIHAVYNTVAVVLWLAGVFD